MKEAPANPGYLARHYSQVFKGGLSFSGFERDRLYWNGADGAFFDASPVSGCDSPGDGRGAVHADFDDDGDTDLFVHNVQGERQQLYRNEIGAQAGWVRLTLQGTKSNRDAIGALLTAKVGARTLVRPVLAGAGFASCSERRVLLGLGDAARADAVTIAWPSGAVQELGPLARGTGWLVVEGQPPRPVDRPAFRIGGDGLTAVRVKPGAEFPAFDLAARSGGRARADAGGRWLLVNFWHPTCAPCKAEMPLLEKLAKAHSGSLAVAGLALVKDGEGPAVDAAVTKLGVTYPIAILPSPLGERLFSGPDLPIPTTFLVAPDGRVARVYQGADGVVDLTADVALAVAGRLGGVGRR